jgi:hypothetical protein
MTLSLKYAREKLLKQLPPPPPPSPLPRSTPLIPTTPLHTGSPIPFDDHREAYDPSPPDDSGRMSTSSSSTPSSPSVTRVSDVCDEQFPLSELWGLSIQLFAN